MKTSRIIENKNSNRRRQVFKYLIIIGIIIGITYLCSCSKDGTLINECYTFRFHELHQFYHKDTFLLQQVICPREEMKCITGTTIKQFLDDNNYFYIDSITYFHGHFLIGGKYYTDSIKAKIYKMCEIID